jgi:hypothetical protein
VCRQGPIRAHASGGGGSPLRLAAVPTGSERRQQRAGQARAPRAQTMPDNQCPRESRVQSIGGASPGLPGVPGGVGGADIGRRGQLRRCYKVTSSWGTAVGALG